MQRTRESGKGSSFFSNVAPTIQLLSSEPERGWNTELVQKTQEVSQKVNECVQIVVPLNCKLALGTSSW